MGTLIFFYPQKKFSGANVSPGPFLSRPSVSIDAFHQSWESRGGVSALPVEEIIQDNSWVIPKKR